MEEGLRIYLDEVASDEEWKQIPEDGDVSKFDTYYDVKTSDQEPEGE